MSERERRISENEALHRAVNERIEGLNEAFGAVSETMLVLCECGDMNCMEQIELDIATYERVRSDSTHFVIAPGHEIPEVETVIERDATFHIVRKKPGDPADVARETATRT